VVSDNKSDVWRLHAQLDSQGLIDALKQEDAGIRRRAAAGLRALGAQDALAAIREALIDEQDPAVKEVLASALEHISDQDEAELTDTVEFSDTLVHVNSLIDMLNNDNPDQLIDAAQQLGDYGDPIAVEPLVLIFNSPKSSMQVKLAVAEALLKLDGAPVEVALLAALRHTDWHIRRNGAAILGQLKAEWAAEPLSRALRDSHSTVRRTARAALQRIGTDEALRALHQSVNQTAQVAPSKPRPRPKSSSAQAETIPSAPRDGLLNRLKAQTRVSTSGRRIKH
jgi:HEAT repeat protein